MTLSLRLRLLAFSAVSIVLALAAVWYLLGAVFERQIARDHERRLSAVTDTLAAKLELAATGWQLRQQPVDPRYGVPGSGEYWQINGDLPQPLRSRSMWDTSLGTVEGKPLAGSGLVTMTGPAGEPVVVFAVPVDFTENGKNHRFTLVAATSRAAFDEAVASFRAQMLQMLLVTGTALILASALQVMAGLSPLSNLPQQVADVRSGLLRRMAEGGPKETEPLVNEINQLLEARERDLDKARNTASDLAHGLKTPLTILSQISEEIARGRQKRLASEMAGQVAAIRERVDRQLAVARMSSLHGRTTQLREAVLKLSAVIRRLPAPGPVVWEIDGLPDCALACDLADFTEALGNILDNARKFTRSRVEISTEHDGDMVAITVGDDGPGVPEDRLAAILERGVRLDSAASETGLGLAIAREIAEANGGSLRLANRAQGGLQTILTLPAA